MSAALSCQRVANINFTEGEITPRKAQFKFGQNTLPVDETVISKNATTSTHFSFNNAEQSGKKHHTITHFFLCTSCHSMLFDYQQTFSSQEASPFNL